MNKTTQPYKGARDFYPEDKRFQNWMFSVLRKTVESYGYEEYDAPVLEPTELYTLKGSEEIVSEQTYTFTDRGGRSVTMRTEMTPSVSRMVAGKRQELPYPLRWYSIPALWRYERPQRGRLREFWQLNVDMFGVSSLEAEIEMLKLSDDILKAYGAKREMYSIRINSRIFMDYVLRDYVGLDEVEAGTIRRLIDRMHKMDYVAFGVSIESAMNPSQREDGSPEKLLKVLAARTIDELPEDLQTHEKTVQLKQLLQELSNRGVTNAVFDPTLMRGFDYYTDVVFEVFDENPENNRSMFGGGRYDGLVGLFGAEPVPTIGFGMGDATLENFLRDHELVPALPNQTHIYIAVVGGDEVIAKAQKIITTFRQEDVNVAVDITNRKIGKQIETAVKKGIRYVIVIGENELDTDQLTLRDIQSSSEEAHSIERIISLVLAK